MSTATCSNCHGTGKCPACGGGVTVNGTDVPSQLATLRRDLSPWIAALVVLAFVTDPCAVGVGIVCGVVLALGALTALICMAMLS